MTSMLKIIAVTAAFSVALPGFAIAGGATTANAPVGAAQLSAIAAAFNSRRGSDSAPLATGVVVNADGSYTISDSAGGTITVTSGFVSGILAVYSQ